jgi:glycosyltransferase involved in cell wall biosynthesis
VAGSAPKESVVTIIPTIGRPSLSRAVASALAQHVPGHRVIVVTDGPRELPALPPEVRVIRTSRQCGVAGVVRNIALRSSSSDHVAFLDDDNVWHEDHLASCLQTLRATQATLVYASAVRVGPDGTHYDTAGRPWNRDAARWDNFVDTSAVVCRRIRGLRFSRVPRGAIHRFSEDWDLVYRVSRRYRVAWTGRATLDYTLSAESVAFLEGVSR